MGQPGGGFNPGAAVASPGANYQQPAAPSMGLGTIGQNWNGRFNMSPFGGGVTSWGPPQGGGPYGQGIPQMQPQWGAFGGGNMWNQPQPHTYTGPGVMNGGNMYYQPGGPGYGHPVADPTQPAVGPGVIRPPIDKTSTNGPNYGAMNNTMNPYQRTR